jgi:hypothetical protein
MAIKNQTQTPQKIVISRNNAYIKYNDRIEIPVSMVWIRQYVEYMLTTNQEIIMEVVP